MPELAPMKRRLTWTVRSPRYGIVCVMVHFPYTSNLFFGYFYAFHYVSYCLHTFLNCPILIFNIFFKKCFVFKVQFFFNLSLLICHSIFSGFV